MSPIKRFLKQLFCKHEYIAMHGLHCFEDKGIKIYYKKSICPNCGKVIFEYVGTLMDDIKKGER